MVEKKEILGNNRITDFNKSDLKIISSVYLSKSKELFKNKFELTKSNEGKWQELVYCILAGSQFPVNKLKIIFPVLFTDYKQLFELKTFKTFGQNERKIEIARILKKLGYRYHTQKAMTIISAADYFVTQHKSDIKKFISNNSDVNIIRKTLVKDIKGIGIKIASHWLRNIGLPVCTIDVHLRRLLCNISISNENPEGALKDSDFLILENIFKEWSMILKIDLGILQFSVWEYTRNYCSPLNCSKCPFLAQCKRGKLYSKHHRQLNLF
jgi:thermostable 8-oxoguanine DNA glycosylase